MNPVAAGFRWVARQLAGRGVVDDRRGERLADLAWPRFLTMFARFSVRAADIAMVGLAVGPAAIAGLAFAAVYWQFALAFGLGVAGGTIGLVSQHYGGQSDRLDLAIKQSLWLGLAALVPLVPLYWVAGPSLVDVLASDPAAVRYGGSYLRLTAIAIPFVTLNVLASRTLAGADDTRIAMSVRATGAAANIVLNAVFVFGLGLGVPGAALGSVLAEALITACFAWGFVAGSLPLVGSFPVGISLGPPYFDRRLTGQLLGMAPPLVAQHLGRVLVRFPLFALLATLGPAVVAAFEAGRRVRNLLNALGAGFSMAASSLVGQALGRGDESGAKAYGRDAVGFSGAVYLVSAAVVFVVAGPIAGLFTSDTETLSAAVPFVRVAAVSFVGLGLFRTYGGILKGAGDNRWALYGRGAGLYLVLLPLTYLGTATELGVVGVYLAVVGETWLAALVTGVRVRSGRWAAVGRVYGPAPGAEKRRKYQGK